MPSLYQILFGIFAVYTQIFAIMNPLDAIPIYAGLTENMERLERRRLINHVFLVCTILVIIFTKVIIYLGKSFIRSLARIMAIVVAAVASEMMFSAIND